MRVVAVLLLSLLASAAFAVQPDWVKPKGLLLVYPYAMDDGYTTPHSQFKDFYDSYIEGILKHADVDELTVILKADGKSDAEERRLCSQLLTGPTRTKVRFYHAPVIDDIWIRDWGPLQSKDGRAVKALFDPSYYGQEWKDLAAKDQAAGMGVLTFLNMRVRMMKPRLGNEVLRMDGGNFTHNGNTAIVTDFILADNPGFSEVAIRRLFRTKLGITDLKIVGVKPGDTTGHTDGTFRFLDEKTLLVADYPDVYESKPENISEADFIKLQTYVDQYADVFAKEFNVIRFPQPIPKTNGVEGLGTAEGYYINFMRVGSTVFVPQFGDAKYDKLAVDFLKAQKGIKKVVPIGPLPGLKVLSQQGGVLHCMTSEYY